MKNIFLRLFFYACITPLLSVTPPLFIEVPVSSHESKQSYMCVRRVGRYQGVIIIRKSKKDKNAMVKMTNYHLQNTTLKIKDRVTRTPLKIGIELSCFGKASSLCSNSGTRQAYRFVSVSTILLLPSGTDSTAWYFCLSHLIIIITCDFYQYIIINFLHVCKVLNTHSKS